MSLSRAFTTRRLRGGSDLADSAKMPQRSNTTKIPYNIRDKISAPVQLIHTTNMLSYNAPDIPRPSRSNSTTSKSASDTESQSTADSTPPTSPDVSSSPEPNHLSCYFKTAGSTTTTSPVEAEPPVIPKRSPSHTKKNSYDAIARHRSVSRMSRDSDNSVSTKAGQTFSRSPSTSTRASSASHASSPLSQKQANPPPPPAASTGLSQLQNKESHPFGQELAQVTELAEEYSTNNRLDTIDEEQQYLDNRGLKKFSPDDYLSAIHGLSAMFFPERNHATSAAPLWI
ncbi:hypothetical protein VFPPC_12758 [Pochonia chlamydosporia 170]|uniref:Uncharacterized protein n=1 Tax=Pochonia chlamydosporia 170 TaxID=1380566 RepID=A0A179G5B5_METCM|nr:hypothetical protein VFPPC_12758 [Pochonia chlamydosporia 170]OAQ72349.1 hypothetical protein VFPPC_12758 [Pochonia chlamydosporia 170]